MTKDPHEYGIGAGDLVDLVVRGRVRYVGPIHVSLVPPPTDVAVGVWIPAENIRSARLVDPDGDEVEHDDTVRLIEDVIDATSDRMFASGGGRLTVTTDRTAPAILAALVERGWTSTERTRTDG